MDHSLNIFIFRKYLLAGFLILAVGAAFFLWQPISHADDNIKQINQQLEEKKSRTEDLQSQIKELSQSIEARRSQAVSLENQLAILSSQISQAAVEIELAETELEATNLEIAKTKAEITQTEQEVAKTKVRLAALLRERFRLDQQTIVEILLTNETISTFFNQVEATDQIQTALANNLSELKNLKQELAGKVAILEREQESLENLQLQLADKKDGLAGQSSVRAQLLAETRNSEARFQDQLQQAKAEQLAINVEIQSLEKVIRDRLSGQGPEVLAKLGGDGSLIYPVPFKGITAYFHDPGYPYRYIFEHPAVDLRASQGTPVRAAAAGFVARVRDPRGVGLGYAYVMLIHADGFSTVYGHISKALVQEDQFVTQGEIIAQSGGLPGTPGAGSLTTGPHLHFEVRQNGIPVNPLNYLP